MTTRPAESPALDQSARSHAMGRVIGSTITSVIGALSVVRLKDSRVFAPVVYGDKS